MYIEMICCVFPGVPTNAPPQATMLKKMKGKMKRRNTEPMMLVSPGTQLAVHLPDQNVDSPTNHNNTTF